MDRRDALRIIAGTAAIPVLPHELRALGRALRGPRSVTAFQVLSPHQQATVATIAELIIPATDTPGASAAGVPQFIEHMLGAWVEPAEKDAVLAGLADVDTRSRALFGKPFIECAAAQQTAILTTLDQEAAADRDAARDGMRRGDGSAGGEPFFSTMKRLTLVGYYTSEVGAQRELHYQIVPGRFDGCVPLERS